MNNDQIERLLYDIYKCWFVENKDILLIDAIDSKSILSKLSVFNKAKDIVKKHTNETREIKMNSIYTKVVHSQSKDAWNVVGTEWMKKYKIARIPYLIIPDDSITTEINKEEAYQHATFISNCFNEERGKHD
ncbi:MAG: hypothetical protein AB7V16_07130 [Vulcanibacillus sp.]